METINGGTLTVLQEEQTARATPIPLAGWESSEGILRSVVGEDYTNALEITLDSLKEVSGLLHGRAKAASEHLKAESVRRRSRRRIARFCHERVFKH